MVHNVNELSFTVAANKALTFDANRAANFTPGNNYTFSKDIIIAAAYNLAFKDSADLIGQLEFLDPGATSQVVTRNTSNLRLGTNNAAAITILKVQINMSDRKHKSCRFTACWCWCRFS